MNEQEYIAERIDDQIKWYSSKSRYNKKRYHNLRTVIIIVSVAIPFLTGLITEDREWLKIAVGVGGVIIATCEGIISLYKYHENWTEYRLSSEALKREKLLFQTKSGPYREDASLENLVERVENYTKKENINWKKYITAEEGKGQDLSKEKTPGADDNDRAEG